MIKVIAGPCQIESLEHSLSIAGRIKNICQLYDLDYTFKASFDKANRTSGTSERGVGIKDGLEILQAVKDEHKVKILTDVHAPEQAEEAGEVVDVLQIPAFLCRQTDLIHAAAKTGKTVNVKKGQFLSPYEVGNIIEKVVMWGNNDVMITERGTSFGYNNLVVDMKGLEIMKQFGKPIIFDGTHSVQQPGGLGSTTGGNREMVAPLCRAAVAVGVDGIFAEVHQDPDNAPSDGPNMVTVEMFGNMIRDLVKIRKALTDTG
tara:strand:- start:639 stop:1418 length:780 start_codon:yes stop_codon:yes gene_type:complete